MDSLHGGTVVCGANWPRKAHNRMCRAGASAYWFGGMYRTRPVDRTSASRRPTALCVANGAILQANMKDRAAYEGFEISPLRLVHSIAGWNWLACVRFHDQEHLRTYVLFIQNDTITDARFAVETDACAAQIYTQFEVVTGELGRAAAPGQPALY